MAGAVAYPKIGAMAMPLDFKYKKVLQRGRPRHEKFDDFWRKHPPMDTLRWAKIFAPFDALDGFDEEMDSKLVPYEERRGLSESEKEELNRTLLLLRSLTYNGRVARANRPKVIVTYFSPCSDSHNDWYGKGGRYVTMTGICWMVNDVDKTITVGDQRFNLSDVTGIIIRS